MGVDQHSGPPMLMLVASPNCHPMQKARLIFLCFPPRPGVSIRAQKKMCRLVALRILALLMLIGGIFSSYYLLTSSYTAKASVMACTTASLSVENF